MYNIRSSLKFIIFGFVHRNEVIDRTESLQSAEKEKLIERMIGPFQQITKHLSTDHSSTEESKSTQDSKEIEKSYKKDRYESVFSKEELEMVKGIADKIIESDSRVKNCENNKCSEELIFPTIAISANTNSTVFTTTNNNSTVEKSIKSRIDGNVTSNEDIDTFEGFQQFADSLIAVD